jgi:hypothetical protein
MLRLYKPLFGVVALLAVVVAGCGSSSSTNSSERTANGKTTKDKKSSGDKNAKKEQDPRACGKLGITPETTKEGSCIQGQGKEKHSVTYVNGDGTLKLSDLVIEVTKVTTPSSVSGPTGTIKPKAGKTKKGKTIPKAFVVLDLSWKNTGDKGEKLNASGKQLAIQSAAGGGQVFQPAEKAVPDSTYNAKAVKSGDKDKVQAIFQIPENAAKSIELRGAHPQLAVWEFSTAGKKKERPNGFIRLWNV